MVNLAKDASTSITDNMGNTKELKLQPPRIIVQIANLVVGLGLVFSILVIVFSIDKLAVFSGTRVSLIFYQLTLLAGLIFAVLFRFGLSLSDNSKVNLSLLTLSITVPIIGFETYLQFSPSPSRQNGIATRQTDVLIDARTKIQVIDDYRSTGIDAYPNVSGSQFIATNGLPTRFSEENIYPLGTISNKTTVHCNESGAWTIFASDEHGFSNPKGLYLKNNVDIMLVGDSFAEGACVRPNESIASILRASGLNVISLGKGGNGPLLEFASFKEYVGPLQPKVVLWVHYANDIEDLRIKEMQSPFLMNYLGDDDFSQNLMSRQGEIDDVLKDYVDHKYWEKIEAEKIYITEEERAKMEEEQARRDLNNIFSLSGLREILKLTRLREKTGLRPPRPSPTEPVGDTFKEILRKSQEMVSLWGGRFYLVYLHAFERYETGREHDIYFREFVLRTTAELKIPVIDIHREVFSPHEDPLSLFPGRKARHYNAEGYRLIEEAISKRLKKDGLSK